MLKDIIQRNSVRNVSILENLTKYIFDNIGNIFSAKKITDFLKSQNLKVGVETIQNYLAYLGSTFVIHKVPRYDITGRRLLELHEKYYPGDIGLRHALLGFREFSVLQQIKDNYPKYVITMDTIFGHDFEGIKRVNLIDFLLGQDMI